MAIARWSRYCTRQKARFIYSVCGPGQNKKKKILYVQRTESHLWWLSHIPFSSVAANTFTKQFCTASNIRSVHKAGVQRCVQVPQAAVQATLEGQPILLCFGDICEEGMPWMEETAKPEPPPPCLHVETLGHPGEEFYVPLRVSGRGTCGGFQGRLNSRATLENC